MKWHDVYEHICLIGEFWEKFDKQQYKQRWGNERKNARGNRKTKR